MKVIRKQPLTATSVQTSDKEIEAIQTEGSIILTESVKETITITYDELGYPDFEKVNLGVQYDHRVTWLHFNLDKLIWHLNAEKGYTQDIKYNFYVFKIAFTKIDNNSSTTSVYQFDGVDFEIPRAITKDAGNYRLVLFIEEDKPANNRGNWTTDDVERFVTKEIKGKVIASFYNPNFLITDEIINTSQQISLRKPTIYCHLADTGELTSNVEELGQQFDNCIRYLKFDTKNITAHLKDFHIFSIYHKDDLFFASPFEKADPLDPNDDYERDYPLLSWVPTGVYESAGRWEVAIIAFIGNLDDLNNVEELNGDYYFYVSKTIKMKVAKNFLTLEEAIKPDPVLAVTSNLLDNDGALILTKDENIFQAKRPEDTKWL